MPLKSFIFSAVPCQIPPVNFRGRLFFMRQKLTVLIPCKDEAHNIRDCIDSVRNIAAEILIADSGSTDETLEIVADLASSQDKIRVVQREYKNPSSFKNWAIPQAMHPWVMALDADERVTDNLAVEINQLLAETPKCEAYRIPRINYFLGNPIRFSGWQRDAPVRLFRGKNCQYDDRHVHEHLMVPSKTIGRLQNSLLHYTCDSLKEMLEKNIRYAQLAAQDLQQKGCQPGLMNLAIRPLLRFLRHYLWKQGFRDGRPGLLLSCLAANSVFTKYAFLWTIKNRPVKTSAVTPEDTANQKKCLGLSENKSSAEQAA